MANPDGYAPLLDGRGEHHSAPPLAHVPQRPQLPSSHGHHQDMHGPVPSSNASLTTGMSEPLADSRAGGLPSLLPQKPSRTKPTKPFKSLVPDGETWAGMFFRMFCRCGSSGRVPLAQRWEMDPIRKWYHYHVFPRTLLLHLALIVTVTTQIVLVNQTTSQFSQNLHNSWVAWLFPSQMSNWEGNPLTYPTDEYFMYRTDQLSTSFQTFFSAYYEMDKPTTTIPDIIDTYSGASSSEGLRVPRIVFSSQSPPNELLAAIRQAKGLSMDSPPLSPDSSQVERHTADGTTIHAHTGGEATSATASSEQTRRVDRRRSRGRDAPPRDEYGNIAFQSSSLGSQHNGEGATQRVNAATRAAASWTEKHSTAHMTVGLANTTTSVPALAPNESLLAQSLFAPSSSTVTVDGLFVTTYDIHSLADFNDFVHEYMETPAAAAYFAQHVLALEVDVQIKTYNLAGTHLSSGVCLLWDISVVYDLSAHGVIYTYMEDSFNTCQVGWAAPSPLMFLAIAIILLAFLQQFTMMRQCFKTWRIMQWASILLQTSRFHARRMKLTRRLASVNRRARLQAAIAAVAARQATPKESLGVPQKVDAFATPSRSSSILPSMPLSAVTRASSGGSYYGDAGGGGGKGVSAAASPHRSPLARVIDSGHGSTASIRAGGGHFSLNGSPLPSHATGAHASRTGTHTQGGQGQGQRSHGAWGDPPKYASIEEAAAAGELHIPHIHMPSDGGSLDTGVWPLIAAALGCHRKVHSHFGSQHKYVDHLAGDKDDSSSSSSSSSSDEGEDTKDADAGSQDDDTSCSCSSSEFSESSDSDIEDPNLVYLGLVDARAAAAGGGGKRRRSSSSRSSSSSSRSSDSGGSGRTKSPFSSYAGSSYSGASSHSSRASHWRKKMRPLQSLAQQAAQVTTAFEKRARGMQEEGAQQHTHAHSHHYRHNTRLRRPSRRSSNARSSSSSSSSSEGSKTSRRRRASGRRPRRGTAGGGGGDRTVLSGSAVAAVEATASFTGVGAGSGVSGTTTGTTAATGTSGAGAVAPRAVQFSLSPSQASGSGLPVSDVDDAGVFDSPKPALLGGPGMASEEVRAVLERNIDWSQPDMMRQSLKRQRGHANVGNSTLLKAIHRLRHAARHLKPVDILALFDPWFFLSTVANVCNIVYACLSLILGEASVSVTGRIFLGLAATLDWVTITQYFKYNGNYYLLARTFSTSAPAIVRNIAGALPMYLTFVLFGVLVFGPLTERFDGLPWSAIAFFAVANGDVVRETFQMSLYYQAGWFFQVLAQLTMYAFCCLFIYAILKTTTAINEQSYLLVRPLPQGATAGARAAAIPGATGRADSALLAFRLPRKIRRLFLAMQHVRNLGGAIGPVVASAASSMPRHVQHMLDCCNYLTCGWYSRACGTCYQLFCCCFGSEWTRKPTSSPVPAPSTGMRVHLPHASNPGRARSASKDQSGRKPLPSGDRSEAGLTGHSSTPRRKPSV